MNCKNCGSNKFVKKDGMLICEYCGSGLEIERNRSKYVSKEDYDRYNKICKIPLKDIPDEDVIWCYLQENQSNEYRDEIWLRELEYRKIKI
jgi:hypothetical protein